MGIYLYTLTVATLLSVQGERFQTRPRPLSAASWSSSSGGGLVWSSGNAPHYAATNEAAQAIRQHGTKRAPETIEPHDPEGSLGPGDQKTWPTRLRYDGPK